MFFPTSLNFNQPSTKNRADEGTTEYHKLTSIDSLVGALSGRKYVLGKISEITEGCYYLEVYFSC